MQKNVVEYLENSYILYPDKLAYSDGEKSFTYAQLRFFSRKLAYMLIRKNIVKKNIGIWIDRSVDVVASFYASMYSNNCYIPLDTEMGLERIKNVINACRPSAFICNNKTAERIKSILLEREIENVEIINIDDFILDEFNDGNDVDACIEKVMDKQIDVDPIYIVYTSGSSGVPKGVVANHRNVVDYIENLGYALGFDNNSVFGNQSPLYIDACTKDVFSSLRCSGTTYILPKSLFMFPVKLVEYLNEKRINTICWVVSALRIVSMMKTFDKITPKYVRLVTFGGEKFDIGELNKWIEALPRAKFYNLYGPTEATGMSMYYLVEKKLEKNDVLYIGRAFRNTEIMLLNEDKPACIDEVGDIYIRGAGVAMGYYRDFNRTSEAFIQNPLHSDYPETVYKTGDRGRFDDKGRLIFSGRSDNQIKHMGYRIELGEIDMAVLSQSNVSTALSVYIEKNKKIYLFYVGSISIVELKKYISSKLPRHMTPSKLIKLEKMPLTNSGKIDKQALKLSLEE